MNDRELMQQALEAFEWNYNTDLDNIPACEQWAKMLKENIAALRAALAEPEQEPVAAWENKYGMKEWEVHAIRAGWMPAPTPRKPVAVVTRKTGNPGITMSWWHEPALPVGTSLYTAPISQSKPLTDEKIKDILLGIDPDTKRLPPGFRDFARAIEKAHGIGEQT